MGSMRRNMPSRQQTNVNTQMYQHNNHMMGENPKGEYINKLLGGKGGRRMGY